MRREGPPCRWGVLGCVACCARLVDLKPGEYCLRQDGGYSGPATGVLYSGHGLNEKAEAQRPESSQGHQKYFHVSQSQEAHEYIFTDNHAHKYSNNPKRTRKIYHAHPLEMFTTSAVVSIGGGSFR